MAESSTSGWRVKFAGPCARCGTTLEVGTIAVWDRRTKSMQCVECPGDRSAPPADSPPPLDLGVAGGSARREHERRAANREAEVKGRWGDRVGGWILRLSDEPASTRTWAIGARGEEQLAESLAAVPGLQVLNDRRVKGTRGNIDHIVIGPAGIFVVDAKRYVGTIRIGDVGPFWRSEPRLYVGRRDQTKLAEAMAWQVEAVEAGLGAAGIDSLPPIASVLCFVDGEWPIFRPPKVFRGVPLESDRSIRRLVQDPVVLDGPEIEALTRVLAEALPAK